MNKNVNASFAKNHVIIDQRTLDKLYGDYVKEVILSKYNFPDKPSSDGFYHINIKDDTKKSGRTQLKAKTLEDLKNKVYELESAHSDELKFKNIFKLVQNEKVLYVKNKEKKLSIENSVNRRVDDYNRFFAGTRFENKDVTTITKDDIETICLYNLSRYDLKKKAFLGMRGIIKNVFIYAYSNYLIADDPYKRVDFRQSKFVNMIIDESDVDKRAYTEDEIVNALDYIRAYEKLHPNYMPSYALELQILAGLRRGELPPLTRTDVNLQNKTLYISREQITVKKEDAPDRLEIVSHTKTWKDRYFPITNELEEYFKRLFAALDKYYPSSEFLFPCDTAENKVITNYMVYGFYSRMCKKLGIKISRDLTRGPHGFRRNAETKALMKAGGDLTLVTPIFGNTPEVAKKHYVTAADTKVMREILNG